VGGKICKGFWNASQPALTRGGVGPKGRGINPFNPPPPILKWIRGEGSLVFQRIRAGQKEIGGFYEKRRIQINGGKRRLGKLL